MRFLPPPGPPRVLALAQLANSIGDGAFYATSALFFTRVVGLSATQVGLALTVAWAIGMLAGVPLGMVADRWGARRTAVLLAILALLIFGPTVIYDLTIGLFVGVGLPPTSDGPFQVDVFEFFWYDPRIIPTL